jgi:hypothetical protein
MKLPEAFLPVRMPTLCCWKPCSDNQNGRNAEMLTTAKDWHLTGRPQGLPF